MSIKSCRWMLSAVLILFVSVFVVSCASDEEPAAAAPAVTATPAPAVTYSKNYHSWAPTPPMGWNSWDCFGCSVTEDEVKANADYMAKHLKKSGWEYIVVDIQWYEPKSNKDSRDPYSYPRDLDTNIDEYGRVWPAANKHPSSVDGNGFKPLADYVHSLGLKFGVHMMRGIPKVAYERNTPILGTEYTARDIANTRSTCPWNPDMYGVDASKPGAQEYYNSIIDQIAGWGVDYIKIDDLSRPYHQGEVELIRNAIDKNGRPIVFSTSPGATPLSAGDHVKDHANLWRISDDFWDNWTALKEQFERLDNWTPYRGDGYYPDADMLPLGNIRARSNGWTRFTEMEQETMMSLWAIARSPLMMGGHMPENDDYTLSLMTNDEMLYVNKYSINGRQLFRENEMVAWCAEDRNSDDIFIALFNAQDSAKYDTPDATWSSSVISRSSAQKSEAFAVELDGTTDLYLIADDAGDGMSWDHADWLEVVLVDDQGNKSFITDMEWESATTGWGEIATNRSASGGDISVDGKVYQNSIGAHAVSVVHYKLPAGKYVKVEGMVGLDDAAARQNAPGSTLKFHIYTKEPKVEAKSAEITIDLAELGFDGSYKVRDLWQKKDLGSFTGKYSTILKEHGSQLLRISK